MENGDAESSESDSRAREGRSLYLYGVPRRTEFSRQRDRYILFDPVSVPGDCVVSPCVAGVFLLDGWASQTAKGSANVLACLLACLLRPATFFARRSTRLAGEKVFHKSASARRLDDCIIFIAAIKRHPVSIYLIVCPSDWLTIQPSDRSSSD